MSENEPGKPKKGWGCLQWGVVVGAVWLLLSLFMPTYGRTTQKALQMKAGSNARQITGLLMVYASDNNGLYPDLAQDLPKRTSNEAFRVLFQEGLVQDESIFGCPGSPFIPDRILGAAPEYAQALEPGENHWMMVAGLENTSRSHYPVVMENAVSGTWPPQWLPYKEPFFSFSNPLRSPGMAWKNGEFIMCMNDASVQTVKLILKDGLWHLPESVLKPAGKETLPEFKILDVE